MQLSWTHVSVSQLPKGLPPLSLSSYPLTVSRIRAGSSLHLYHPPTSKPPAAEVSSSLVLCFHSCCPSAYSPHRNQEKPLEMYDIVLIFCLNLPHSLQITFPQGVCQACSGHWTSDMFLGFFLCIYKKYIIFYFSKMR